MRDSRATDGIAATYDFQFTGGFRQLTEAVTPNDRGGDQYCSLHQIRLKVVSVDFSESFAFSQN
jgi:hypothetical protein